MNNRLRFTTEKITKRIDLIRPLVQRQKIQLSPFDLEILDNESMSPGSGQPIGTVSWNSYWAGQDTHFVLRGVFSVPQDYANPALFLPLGTSGDIFTHPEALVKIDDRIIASVSRYHTTIPIPASFADGREHNLMLHGWTGYNGWPPDTTDTTRLQIRECLVTDIDTTLRDLVLLAEVTLDVVNTLNAADRLVERLLTLLDHVFVTLDTRHPMRDAFRKSVPFALSKLMSGLNEVGVSLPENLTAVGHAHMDIAYLWPIAQIRQKNARTYSNVLRLMDSYPDFFFSHSQPQLYDYTETDFPEIFTEIKKRVEEGQWEVMGGMWVEADCNIPGAEALVRQILLGRTYFQEKFGDVETPVLWLPDTFGFPWSLPQLMKLSGLTCLVSNKLNWNQYNKMPSSSTWWQGIDGTRVLTHFLTTPREVDHLPFPTNYKSDLSAKEVMGTVSNATTGSEIDNFMIAFGYGDGGGGPTEELILKARIFSNMPGTPRLTMGSVKSAINKLEKQSANLPVWNGELYMEGHRGTLTSQGWIKRANRLLEQQLHDTEAALVIASPKGLAEDIRQKLKELWRTVCLHQFHDILTGVSITPVFDEARQVLEETSSKICQLRNQALYKLVEGEGYTIFNPASVPSERAVFLPGQNKGQAVEGGSLVAIPSLPAYGLEELQMAAKPGEITLQSTKNRIVLENTYLKLTIDTKGMIKSIIHKPTGNEVIQTGERGNQLWVYEDRPLSWDAWDIDVFIDDRSELLDTPAHLELIEQGPLRCAVRFVREFRNSRIVQTIRLVADSPRVDFVTEIDWNEQHTLLKVAFPVNVLSPRATYEIQWGEIERSTHQNTSWDFAQFEVPGHKWADISERGFGVALLNDCKYGYSIKENTIRLTLIKSATNPDPRADQGKHRFTYALLPHEADPTLVRQEARRLNDPLIVIPGTPKSNQPPIISVSSENVIVETVKPSEDGNGFVLRLYETNRQRGEVVISFGIPINKVFLCNLLEANQGELDVMDNSIKLFLHPFEIISLRCIPGSDNFHVSR